MAVEPHVWQPVNGGDTLADASWDTLAPAGQASEFGTFSGLPANNGTVAINASGHVTPGSDKTYTFKTTLTPAANEVKIGSDAAECARNLVSAIMADGNTDRYGAGTVAHDAVTAILSGSDVQLTSVHYGTDPNDIVLADSATNFVWDGGATSLSDGVTTWSLTEAEIILNGDNHSAPTTNLDWDTLLSPAIQIANITKYPGNFSDIASSGTPWIIRPYTGAIINLMGSGVIYFEFQPQGPSPDVIQDGPELLVLTGDVQHIHVKRGRCEYSGDFDTQAGPTGSVATTSGANAVLILLDSTKEGAGQIVADAGFIESNRDIRAGDVITVGDGHVLYKGTVPGVGLFQVLGTGSLDMQPRSFAATFSAFLLMGGRTTFANSEFVIGVLPLVIGPRAHVEFGPIGTLPQSDVIDLRKHHP